MIIKISHYSLFHGKLQLSRLGRPKKYSHSRATLLAFQVEQLAASIFPAVPPSDNPSFVLEFHSWTRLFQPTGSAGCPPGATFRNAIIYRPFIYFRRFLSERPIYQGVDRYLNFVLWSVKRCLDSWRMGERARHSTIPSATPFCARGRPHDDVVSTWN